MIICSKCGKEKKPSELSYRKYKGKIGYRGKCKECHNEYQKELREQDVENYDKNFKKWLDSHREEYNEAARDRWKEKYHKDLLFREEEKRRAREAYHRKKELKNG